MEFESLDEIVLAFACIELLGYTAKGFLYYFSKFNSDISLTEEGLVEMKRPMIYNFIKLIYGGLSSRVIDNPLEDVGKLDKQVL